MVFTPPYPRNFLFTEVHVAFISSETGFVKEETMLSLFLEIAKVE